MKLHKSGLKTIAFILLLLLFSIPWNNLHAFQETQEKFTFFGPPGGNILDMVSNLLDRNIIYACEKTVKNSGLIYKTTNGGESWLFQGLLPLFYFYCFEIDPYYPNILYAGTSVGVYKSENEGCSWHLKDIVMNLRISPFGIKINNHNSNILYGLGRRSLSLFFFKSIDTGENYECKLIKEEADFSGVYSPNRNLWAIDQGSYSAIYIGIVIDQGKISYLFNIKLQI